MQNKYKTIKQGPGQFDAGVFKRYESPSPKEKIETDWTIKSYGPNFVLGPDEDGAGARKMILLIALFVLNVICLAIFFLVEG